MPNRAAAALALALSVLASPAGGEVAAAAPPAAPTPAAPTPTAAELKAVLTRYNGEVDGLRKRRRMVEHTRRFPVTGGTATLSTGEEWFSYEVALQKPVSRAAAQAVAAAIFRAAGQTVAIDFDFPTREFPRQVLYNFLYEEKTVQLGPNDDGAGAGCSVTFNLDSAGRVQSITYTSGS